MPLQHKFVAAPAHGPAQRGTHLRIGRIEIYAIRSGGLHHVQGVMHIFFILADQPFTAKANFANHQATFAERALSHFSPPFGT